MSKLVKNIQYVGFVQIINYVFPLITIPYVSRIIGPEYFGIINYATAFMGYFVMLISYGFDLSATRRIAQNPDDFKQIDNVFSEILNARIVLFFISLFLFSLAINFIAPLKNNLKITMLLFVMILSNVFTPQYIYQGMQNLKIFAKGNLIKSIISTILIFLFINKQSDYVFLVAINVLLTLGMSIVFLFHAKKTYNLRFKFLPIKKTISIIWSEKIIFLSSVVISLYTTTNIVLLGFFDDLKNIGFFTTSQNLVNITTTVLTVPLSTALYPKLGFAFSKSKETGLKLAKQILPVIFYFIILSCLILFLFAPLIINFLYGDEFKNSILPMRIMAFCPLIISLSNFFAIQIMLNLNLDKVVFKVILVCSVFGLMSNILMSHKWGYIGTAFNVLLIESTVTSIFFIVLKKMKIEIINFKDFMPKNIWFNLKIYIGK